MGVYEEKFWLNSQLKRISNREFSSSNPTERNIARTLAELRDAKRWIETVGVSAGVTASWVVFQNIVNTKIKIFSSVCLILACREYAYSFAHEDLMNAVHEVLEDYEKASTKNTEHKDE